MPSYDDDTMNSAEYQREIILVVSVLVWTYTLDVFSQHFLLPKDSWNLLIVSIPSQGDNKNVDSTRQHLFEPTYFNYLALVVDKLLSF